MRDTIAALRVKVSALEGGHRQGDARTFPLGVRDIDRVLGGGIARGAVHEVYAAQPADAPTASGFALAAALQASADRPLVWARHDFAATEAGWLHGPGLAELGLDPGRLIVVRARNPTDALRVGSEAAACAPLGAVLMEVWGNPPALNLTATRRLSIAAAASGVTLMIIRAGASPMASAASTRWSVKAAASTPLEANAPGRPAFDITLLRHRNGMSGRNWIVEWDRDRRAFDDAAQVASGLVSLPSGGSAAAAVAGADWRRAG